MCIRLVLWKIQSGHDCVHRRTDGRTDGQTDKGNQCTLSQLRWARACVCVCVCGGGGGGGGDNYFYMLGFKLIHVDIISITPTPTSGSLQSLFQPSCQEWLELWLIFIHVCDHTWRYSEKLRTYPIKKVLIHLKLRCHVVIRWIKKVINAENSNWSLNYLQLVTLPIIHLLVDLQLCSNQFTHVSCIINQRWW